MSLPPLHSTALDFTERVQEILEDTQFKPHTQAYQFVVAERSEGLAVQLVCTRRDTYTGEYSPGFGGWRTLTPNMTDSQIVRILFGAAMAYEEHEVREGFLYQDKRIFGPHIDVSALADIADCIEVRP